MKLELLQLLSKTHVPDVPFVPSTESAIHSGVSQLTAMEQMGKEQLFCLFHEAKNNEYGTSRTYSNNILVPSSLEQNSSHNNVLIDAEQTEQMEQLASLIAQAGKLYHATEDEITDMQNHVLQFVKCDPENLNIALKGFKELAKAC